MRTFKRIACAAVAACFAFSLTLTGCSTPEYAMTVDGGNIPPANTLPTCTMSIIPWRKTWLCIRRTAWTHGRRPSPYGEGDAAENISTAEFIKRTAQDSIIRQKAIENLLEQKNIPLDAEKLAEVEETLAELGSNAYIAYGFNNESFAKMYKATQLNEWSLFYGTYDKGGVNPMSEEEIRKYFDDNFLSYKIIEFKLVDTSNQPLDDDVIQDYRDRLAKYLAEFEKLGVTSDNFDTVIKMKEEDDMPDDSEDSGSSGESSSTTTASSGTTSPLPPPMEPPPQQAPAMQGDSGDTEDTDSTTDPNRQDIDANIYGDEDFTNAVKKVEIGTASIQEYKKERHHRHHRPDLPHGSAAGPQRRQGFLHRKAQRHHLRRQV